MANTKGTSVITPPSGGGAQSGLGEKFSPDLFTGTGNFSVPIAVPPGRNGFQPELTLGYSSGNGNGAFGMGWALGIPGVARKTSKGIPVYEDKSDIFILSGAEDLVPISVEHVTISDPQGPVILETTRYKPRTEGLFALVMRHKKTNGEHYWEVRSKDGLISWYGTPGAGPGDTAITADPENRQSIFSWHLTKTQDPFGNVILYEYTRDLHVSDQRSYDQLYLSKIKYAQYTGDDGIKYMCEIGFIYEDRPDAFSSYKQGFETRITKRCSKIETYTNAASKLKTKTYHFNYKSELPLNGASLLEAVKVEGHPSAGSGEESEWMPPLEFSYSEFDPAKRSLTQLKGPLPFMSLGEPGFEFVDLDGNGLPDLLQLNGTARYWINKGNGEFSQPRNLNIAPNVQLGMPGVQMIDANGDGRTDLLVNNGQAAGYFPGAFHSVWDSNSFRPYKNIPSFSFADPEVQLIDLDGDGITDVLRNGKRFECFYNDPEKGFSKARTAGKKFADFSFADPRIRFADMTGDGLQDIVLISSGRVQYWPNLGYGRFGNKINMANPPHFPQQYNPQQILLGDLDGDGQADIAFVDNNTVTLYVNQSGNGFSNGVKIPNTPRVENLKAMRIIDIMGNGQAGILWSFGAASGTPGRLYFLNLNTAQGIAPNKPYVLEEMNNNMGSLTRVSYGSSVYHYLRDQQQPATRWKTDLPFPVQVVNRVEVFDQLAGGKLVTEYSYHNGYWDGVEREFRGFAHVDATDTESFEQYNLQQLFADKEVTPVASLHYSPPTLTKSWFYAGPVGDGFSRWKEPDFSDEYWGGDINLLTRPQEMNDLLAALPRRARRDALRTLRGSLLRSELYALDGSDLQNRPYTVTESCMSLSLKFDPSQLPDPLWSDKNSYWSGGGYIFFPFNIGQRTTQYERGTDPMHNFSFTKAYDNYGQALGQLSVGVPRGYMPGTGAVQNTAMADEAAYLATYSLADYIDDAQATGYMKNRVKRSRSWDASRAASGVTVFALRDSVFVDFETLPVIACTLNFYDGLPGDEFTGLNYGLIGKYGAQVRSETLIITSDIINAAYQNGSPAGISTPPCFETLPDWSAYPLAFEQALQDPNLGYKWRSGSDYISGWYAQSPGLKYDFHADPLTALGLTLQSKDTFDAWQRIDYDPYWLMPVRSTQYLAKYPSTTGTLETLADYDYRVMQPKQVQDPNLNISVFDFSPLGLLRATALIGKGTEGDYIGGPGTGFYQLYEPSVRMDYDFFAFKDTQDPVWVKTISREQHYAQSPLSPSIEKVEYSDGFGRLLQTRTQAEDVIFGNQKLGSSGLPASQSDPSAPAIGTERGSGTLLNVVVSGWKIYNNKGKVVEQYEPFFDKGFDYVLPDLLGVKIKMFYDPIGRVVKTINPDNSQQWVIYGIPGNLAAPADPVSRTGAYVPTPWESYTYDANDLAPVKYPTGNPVPAAHWYTPKSAVLDALGRTLKTTEHIDKVNTPALDNIVMQYRYDIRGNLLLVLDPYYREVFSHIYDLRVPGKDQPLPPIRTRHIDKGASVLLFDAAGKPVESNDAKGAKALSAYDVISRPNSSWACNKTGESITLRNKTIYGEGTTTPATYNLNGRVYESYDEAGMLHFTACDFKGNVLSKTRSVIDNLVLKGALATYTSYVMDWDMPPALSPMVFTSDMAYDALNRITQLTLPQDVSAERKKIIPAYNKAGALEKVKLGTSAGTTTYVENIAYNARGQRLLIAFGNTVMSRYVYDSNTFRLLRQRSEKYRKTTVGNTVTYEYITASLRQDDGFNYDLTGNIIKLLDRMTNCGIGGTPNALDRNFTYDPIYRLTSTTGRESNTQNNSYLYNDAPSPSGLTDVRAYSRTYTYDKLGNVQKVIQSGTNGFTRDFRYNAGVNTLQKIVDSSATTIENFTYDMCGNQITAGGTRNYKWNHADQLTCYYNQAGASPTVFTQYDYAGQDRVSKLVRTGNTYQRTVYIDGIFEYCILENGTTYEKNYIHIMDDKSRIAEVRIGDLFPGDITNDVTYIIENQIGSSVMRTDAGGDEIDREEYYPFGDSSLRTFSMKRYRYVGKEKDAESGLYYYGARYYAAWTCRFISVDPLAGKYAHLSPYNYASNNPVTHRDVDGMQNPAESSSAQGGGNGGAKEGNTAKTNTGAGTNATNTSKLPGFTPSPATTQNTNLSIATTANGPANGQLLSEAPAEQIAPPGNYYPNKQQISYNTDVKAANNLNTQNVSRTTNLSEPTDSEYMQMAQDKAYSGGASVGFMSVGVNTQGDVSTGVQKGSSNTTINVLDQETKAFGASGVMVSPAGVSIDPSIITDQMKNSSFLTKQLSISASNENSVESLGPYITHNEAGVVTGTVQVDFHIENMSANLIVGGFKSTVMAVRNFTSTQGAIDTRTIGTVVNKGGGLNLKLPNGIGLGIEAAFK